MVSEEEDLDEEKMHRRTEKSSCLCQEILNERLEIKKKKLDESQLEKRGEKGNR